MHINSRETNHGSKHVWCYRVACHFATAVLLWLSSSKTPLLSAPPVGTEDEKVDSSSSNLHFFTNSLGIPFVRIPPGVFMMGNAEPLASLRGKFPEAATREFREEPKVEVRITQPFHLATHEVTLRQFLTFYHDDEQAHRTDAQRDKRGGGGFRFGEGRIRGAQFVAWNTGWNKPIQQYMDHPVVNVSWNDCMRFCEWLTRRERGNKIIRDDQFYTLPSEAQWEYACRAGSDGPFWFDDDRQSLSRYENVGDLSLSRLGFQDTIDGDDRHQFTAPVASYPANPWGLHDMHGNVSEWCRDRETDESFRSGKILTPAKANGGALPSTPLDNPEGTNGELRSMRGGSWVSMASYARSSQRFAYSPSSRDDHVGFRIMLVSQAETGLPSSYDPGKTSLAGDIVWVSASTPLREHGKAIPGTVVSRIAATTLMRVHETSGPWLRVTFTNNRDTNYWVHRNEVSRRVDNTLSHDRKTLELRRMIETTGLGDINPWRRALLLLQLPAVLGVYVENGQSVELIEARSNLEEMIDRLPSHSQRELTRASLLGAIGDATRMSGDLKKAAQLTREGCDILQRQIEAINNGRLTFASDEERDQAMSMAAVTLGQQAWALSKYGLNDVAVSYAESASKGLRAVRLAWYRDLPTFDQHAELLLKAGRYRDAIPWLELSTSVHGRFRDPLFHRMSANADSGQTDELRAVCDVLIGKPKEAITTMTLSQRRHHRYLSDHRRIEHPALELILRDSNEDPWRDSFDRAVSLADESSCKDIATLSESVATWVINRKYRKEELLQKRNEAMHGREPYEDPTEPLNTITSGLGLKLGDFATPARIHDLRGIIAEMRLRDYPDDQREAAQREFDYLRLFTNAIISTRVQAISAITNPFFGLASPETLKLRLEAHAKEVDSQWLEVTRLQSLLRADQLVVEFYKYAPFDYASLAGGKHNWLADRYRAFVIQKDKPVRQIDLGLAVDVDKTVMLAIQAIADRKTIDSGNHSKLLKDLFPGLSDLSKLLLEPLRESLQDKMELIVSPDANLWFVPWSALLWSPEKFLLQQVNIRQIRTSRYLALDKNSVSHSLRSGVNWMKPTPGEPLILADPDFDAIYSAEAVAADEPRRGAEPAAVHVARRGTTILPRFGRLPYTRVEAETIKPSIDLYCGAKSKLFLGAQAVEQHLIQSSCPRVLVLSTHGFFLSAEDVANPRSRIQCRDPMLRAGLLLAGANRIDTRERSTGMDGLLTGFEVAALDLRLTELVVLSSCETGLGDIIDAEGALGMRQAFFVAGAKNVLASIWQVPDQDTAFIISGFFDRLSRGMPYSHALREAQIEHVRKLAGEKGIAAPYLWAGLSITE
jgi:formylglycine-generating enzyme required for sulfatase activity/CHAT domain-containing protein